MITLAHLHAHPDMWMGACIDRLGNTHISTYPLSTDNTTWRFHPIHCIRIDPPYPSICIDLPTDYIYFSIIHSSIRMDASTVCLFMHYLLPDRHTPPHLYVYVPLARSCAYVHACPSVCVRARQHTSLCAPEYLHACGLVSSIRQCGCSCV